MNRRTAIHLVSILSASMFGLVPTLASADQVGDALDRVAKARAGVRNLVGRFEQVRAIGLLATAVKSKGEMILVRPDRLRWELFAPDAVTYWVTPDGFAFATPKGGVKTGKGAAGRFGAVLEDLMVMLGGDLKTLRDRYQLSVGEADGTMTITAVPKAADVKKHVKQLELTAGPELWRVKTVVLVENNGDRSDITFTDLQRDKTVDPAKMKP